MASLISHAPKFGGVTIHTPNLGGESSNITIHPPNLGSELQTFGFGKRGLLEKGSFQHRDLNCSGASPKSPGGLRIVLGEVGMRICLVVHISPAWRGQDMNKQVFTRG